VEESGAYSTQLTANETAAEFAEKLKQYAEKWGEIADKIWYDKKVKEGECCKGGTD
jgi:hypothetical protein